MNIHAPVKEEERNLRARSLVMLAGDPGAFKTLTAANSPAPFMFDLEDRGSHAAVPRATFSQDRAGYDEFVRTLKEVSALPMRPEGFINVYGYPTKTVIIDTFDHLQIMLWQKYSGYRNKLNAYGQMKDELVSDVLLPLLGIKANIIVVVHSKIEYPDEENKDANPVRTLALTGSIKNVLPSYFDNIFYAVNSTKSSQTKLITNRQVYEGVFTEAKDTLNIFDGKVLTVEYKDGKANTSVMEKIFAEIQAANVREALEKEIKKDWMDFSKSIGFVSNFKDKGQLQKFLDALGDTLDNIHKPGASQEGLDKIKAAANIPDDPAKAEIAELEDAEGEPETPAEADEAAEGMYQNEAPDPEDLLQ